MRNYEVAYIANPDLDEEGLTTLEGKIQAWIEAAGGTTASVDRWGRRKLAYPIDDYRDGYYYFVQSELPPGGPASLESELKVSEEVLRYMITRQDPA
jgi:small subunit ribosomal protein S6